MAVVSVLIVVDVEGAESSGNLYNNVYLVDTNKYFGSYQEGQAELITACNNLDEINWSVVGIDPNSEVTIDSFQGQMVGNICTPKAYQSPTGTYWAGVVQTQGAAPQQYQYTCTLNFEGKLLTFDPFLNVKD